MAIAGNPQVESLGESELYKNPLHNEPGDLVTVIRCVGINYIGKLDNDGVIKVFRDDQLNQDNLLPPVSGSIDVLIGKNHVSLFPNPIKVSNEVVWAETPFGSILHGSHHKFSKHVCLRK